MQLLHCNNWLLCSVTNPAALLCYQYWEAEVIYQESFNIVRQERLRGREAFSDALPNFLLRITQCFRSSLQVPGPAPVSRAEFSDHGKDRWSEQLNDTRVSTGLKMSAQTAASVRSHPAGPQLSASISPARP